MNNEDTKLNEINNEEKIIKEEENKINNDNKLIKEENNEINIEHKIIKEEIEINKGDKIIKEEIKKIELPLIDYKKPNITFDENKNNLQEIHCYFEKSGLNKEAILVNKSNENKNENEGDINEINNENLISEKIKDIDKIKKISSPSEDKIKLYISEISNPFILDKDSQKKNETIVKQEDDINIDENKVNEAIIYKINNPIIDTQKILLSEIENPFLIKIKKKINIPNVDNKRVYIYNDINNYIPLINKEKEKNKDKDKEKEIE